MPALLGGARADHWAVQETIFAADDAHDMLSACALSGEPLIQSMSPTVDAHAYALDEPFARTVVGERRHLSAYEARTIPRVPRPPTDT